MFSFFINAANPSSVDGASRPPSSSKHSLSRMPSLSRKPSISSALRFGRKVSTSSTSSAATTNSSKFSTTRKDSGIVVPDKPLPPLPPEDSNSKPLTSKPSVSKQKPHQPPKAEPHHRRYQSQPQHSVTAKPATLYACTFCPYTSYSKSHWQLHEEEYHEQPVRWTCPDARCHRFFFSEPKYRRHHAEAHACRGCALERDDERRACATAAAAAQLAGSGEAYHKRLNETPKICAEHAMLRVHSKRAFGCGFCVRLLRSWADRCEHVARHYERGDAGNGVQVAPAPAPTSKRASMTGGSKADWDFSLLVGSLMQQQVLAGAWEAVLTERHGADKRAWPRMRWEGPNNKEGRELVRLMEQHGMVRDKARSTAELAYELGRAGAEAETQRLQNRKGRETMLNQATAAYGIGRSKTVVKASKALQELTGGEGDHASSTTTSSPTTVRPRRFSASTTRPRTVPALKDSQLAVAEPLILSPYDQAAADFARNDIEMLTHEIDRQLACGGAVSALFNDPWGSPAFASTPAAVDYRAVS
ncbi:hypothetical protein IWX90DRAFT_309312 [Phyllosticta citrichinensis]|uniref:C2H2-type domain-containing protein n=1 Tax=Phyllosticta citrichinensis TaxID=1130410 RepID=A0ABR1XLN5_9PEZI